jgi:hypothetical protein
MTYDKQGTINGPDGLLVKLIVLAVLDGSQRWLREIAAFAKGHRDPVNADFRRPSEAGASPPSEIGEQRS